MPTPFEAYLAKIAADLKGGQATELTYRSTLEILLESLEPGIEASSDPKHIACGAPDFVVERRHVPLGYIETKDIGDDLDKVEKSDQLKRYRASLHNLILTDYLEFRWYVNGALKLTTRLATVGTGKKLVLDPDGIAKTAQMFTEFYQTKVPTVGTPKDLAQRMAALTKITRDLIVGSLREEGEAGVFHKQLEAFRHHLLPALTPEEFADIYAQTMAYGLFAARINLPSPGGRGAGGEGFNRAQAYIYLPPANPFLRKLFQDVGEELDGTPIAPFLDDLAALLARADMAQILKDFGKRTRTEDPVVHFYETFLAAYDPKMRESRGVYYTPEPAVQFIVRSVDQLLKTRFNKPLGLADPEVLLLDPATGTATFIYFVIQLIYDTLQARGQAGAWKDYVRDKLLPRLFGFELLMAPYAVAHLKLGLLLRDLGYTFGKHERLGVYLTNTLEQGVTHAETLGLSGYLSEEGSAAAEVKNQKPIMVVTGNPPYSGHSANKGDWISDLVCDYYFVDGQPLGERNPKWLQDDYVKFIRFAQWRVEQTGQGIVAFITNHGYLDNPTFRGMRQHLMNTFDEIYVLDLHGNSKKKETAPDGSKDENVFDIQQGVAILLAVKNPLTLALSQGKRESSSPLPVGEGRLAQPIGVRVHHAHLYGLREGKYQFLAGNDVSTVEWADLQPTSPFYLFVPQDTGLQAEYEQGWRITDIFPITRMGITSGDDAFAYDWSKGDFERKVEAILRTHQWPESQVQKKILANLKRSHLQEIYPALYRAFDKRLVLFSTDVVWRPVAEVGAHFVAGNNIGLITIRRSREGSLQNFFVTDAISDKCVISSVDNAHISPLYLYTTPESTAGTLFAQTETTRAPNFAPEFIQAFSDKLRLRFNPHSFGFAQDRPNPLPKGEGARLPSPTGRGAIGVANRGEGEFTPEDIFYYAYAIFHSPTYRTRYAEFLRIDFPRLPLTSDRKLFARLAAKGAELVSLHLLQAPKLDVPITTFPVSGSNAVDQVRYEKKRVWINTEQYFGGVPQAVWEFHIGGYQVCEKWLKDRKGRKLTGDDIAHYQRIVVALKETIRLMKEIDAAIPHWPIK